MKEDARSLDQKTQATLRQRANVINKQGRSRREVAYALGVNISTIDRWRRERKVRGSKALQPRKRGRRVGSTRDLSPDQEAGLQKMIAEKTPGQLKLAFALWTRKAVCELIGREYGMKIPARTCGEYLNGDLEGALGRLPAPASREQLESNLKIQMRRLKKSPKHVASYCENQYVTYAKAACLLSVILPE